MPAPNSKLLSILGWCVVTTASVHSFAGTLGPSNLSAVDPLTTTPSCGGDDGKKGEKALSTPSCGGDDGKKSRSMG